MHDEAAAAGANTQSSRPDRPSSTCEGSSEGQLVDGTAAMGQAEAVRPELAREWERAWDSSARQAAPRAAPAHAGGASAGANGTAAVLAPATPEQLDGGARAQAPQVGAGGGEPDLAALVRGSPFLDLDSPMTAYEWFKAVAMVRPWGRQPSCREAREVGRRGCQDCRGPTPESLQSAMSTWCHSRRVA